MAFRHFFRIFTYRQSLRIFMQDIIKEYGPAIISVAVIGAMIVLITFLVGSDNTSIVGQAFESMIQGFFDSATGVVTN